MMLNDLVFLQSDLGQSWLAKLANRPISNASHLQWAMRLRKAVGAEKAHVLLETALLRQRAVKKFSRASEMYFDRAGLEMSSAELITTYRAQKFKPFATVADLGCGIGGDAIGLASVANVIAVDRDPIRLAMAQANVTVYGHGTRFEGWEGDLLGMEPFSAEALFFDPARRTPQGKRIFQIARYQPPITLLDRWRSTTQHWGIKISPGFDYAELPPDAHVEFISVQGELREAILWYGDLRPVAQRTATLLTPAAQPQQLTSHAPDHPLEPSPPLAYLYEPDAAIIRAQLVTHLAAQLNATQIDSTIAYLTSDTAAETSFARCFRIEAWFPFQLKSLRRYLREQNVGNVVIKKRGSPIEPDQLQKQLKLRGSEKRTLFLTRVLGEPAVLVAHNMLRN